MSTAVRVDMHSLRCAAFRHNPRKRTKSAGDQTVTFTWNAENRLIAVTPRSPAVNDEKLEFQYDHRGRRIEKTVSTWSGSAWAFDARQRWIYHEWLPLIEYAVNSSGAITGVGRKMTWGDDLSGSMTGAGGIGGLLAVYDVANGGQMVALADAGGNITQLVNRGDGTLRAHYEYDAYGNVITSSGDRADANPFRWSTKYTDAETNLVYYGYRYYDPETGRWLNRDPIGEHGGALLAAFAANNPASNYDPDGRFAICDPDNSENGGRPLGDALSRVCAIPVPCSQATTTTKLSNISSYGNANPLCLLAFKKKIAAALARMWATSSTSTSDCPGTSTCEILTESRIDFSFPMWQTFVGRIPPPVIDDPGDPLDPKPTKCVFNVSFIVDVTVITGKGYCK